MKYSIFALAAVATGALASPHAHRHARRHEAHAVFARYVPADDCVCSTYVTSKVVTRTIQPEETVTVVPIYDLPSSTTTVLNTKYSTAVKTSVVTPESSVKYVPTPEASTYSAPGTYTIPAKTVTLTDTATAVIPKTTTLTKGPNTYGGVTTIIKTATTVTCPVATVETSGSVTTSKVVLTTYVCPTPGTYTIAPTTSTVTATTVVPCEYPVATTYAPGTYTHPESVVTVTKTSQVVVCPYSTTEPSSSEAPSVPASSTAVPTTEKPEAPKPSEAPEPSSEAPETTSEAPETTSEAPKSSEAPKPKPSSTGSYSSGNSGLGAGNGLWSISYSPYNDDHSCKSSSDVAEDIADIAKKGFKAVRVYATECNTLQNVGGACKTYGLKMITGVFIKPDTGLQGGNSQVKDLCSWGKWDLVEAIVIGNEVVLNGIASAQELASYIAGATKELRSAGYKGAITTAETVGVLENPESKCLCDVVDIIGVNIHPFFDGQRTADQAGEFFKTQYKQAANTCKGKDTYVLEAGWPSAGNSNNAAVPGKSEQAKAIKGMAAAVPGHISFFTYRNDGWKGDDKFGIEKNFGCGDVF